MVRSLVLDEKRTVGDFHACEQCFELPSVLWHCWLGDRKGIQPVKTCAPCAKREEDNQGVYFRLIWKTAISGSDGLETGILVWYTDIHHVCCGSNSGSTVFVWLTVEQFLWQDCVHCYVWPRQVWEWLQGNVFSILCTCFSTLSVDHCFNFTLCKYFIPDTVYFSVTV